MKNWIKVHQNCLRHATDQRPSLCHISSCSAKRCTRKMLQSFFYLLVTFGTPGGRLAPKFINLAINVRQGPIYQYAKFRPIRATCVRDTCCQTSLILLTARLTKTVNGKFLHTMWRQKYSTQYTTDMIRHTDNQRQ